MRRVRKLLKWPLLFALRSEWLRCKIVYELRKDFFPNLQISIPLSHGTFCPLTRHDYIYSFSEIFLAGEYGGFLEHMPRPRRWLDLGCHAGFFSLFLAWQWRRAGSEEFSALLVDADPRVEADVTHLLQVNRMAQQFRFSRGLISGQTGEQNFALREGMGSSREFSTHADGTAVVPTMTAAGLLARFPPPYDLIKVDIEGAEFEFLEHYCDVLRHTAFLIIEWHCWDAEGSGESEIQEMLQQRGFQRDRVLQKRKNHLVEGKHLATGCHLYRNLNSAGDCLDRHPRILADAAS